MTEFNNFLEVQAISVNQPFGNFFLASIPARKLVEVCYSFPASYGTDTLSGVQRGLNAQRVKNISKYCLTETALFPNSIILSVNIQENGDIAVENRWYIDENSKLVVPTSQRLASIVDGQHRIEGLRKVIEESELESDFDLVCAIYFELPAPMQAEVFATINFNQQKVDKSLAYQLFGYDLDAEDSEYWAPDTLAIYLSRLLDSEENSPFYNKISFGMKKDTNDLARKGDDDWTVSTSVIVEGIVKLISSNPTKDRYELHKKRVIRKGREILKEVNSTAPLREQYLKYQDGQLYDMVFVYFELANQVIWSTGNAEFMRKTIGIQALFDLLRELVIHNDRQFLNKEQLEQKFMTLDIDTLNQLEVNFSGIGRSQIRNELKEQLSL